MLSLWPANRVWPSADQAMDRHWGGSARAEPGTSGLNSSTMFFDSRSQTLIVGPVAEHSQYLLGEKQRPLMVSMWSRVYRCFPSLRSQSIALVSLPPEAQREPSGDMVTVLRYPLWPMWLVLSLQLVRFHTFTYLSHPADTMMGFWLLGENLTHDTQSLWPSSWMVYLHWARVFHSLMVLSLAADTICLLSAEKATDMTSLVWSSNLRVVFPVERSQSLRVLSLAADRAKWPSEENTTSEMKWPCPCNLFCGIP